MGGDGSPIARINDITRNLISVQADRKEWNRERM
jgi:hypothetical protein